MYESLKSGRTLGSDGITLTFCGSPTGSSGKVSPSSTWSQDAVPSSSSFASTLVGETRRKKKDILLFDWDQSRLSVISIPPWSTSVSRFQRSI